jgi:hypothetical protein
VLLRAARSFKGKTTKEESVRSEIIEIKAKLTTLNSHSGNVVELSISS